jgi:hypothetical protein
MKIEINGYTFEKTENKNGSTLRMECRKPGQEKPYIVAYNRNAHGDSAHEGWGCSCPGWINKRGAVRKCKHLEMIANEMASRKAS